jgi:hypothetical protein
VLAELDLAALVADIGPLPFAGSFVSGLMCWRELDAMVLVGGDFSPQDVLRLLAGIVDQTGATSFEYHTSGALGARPARSASAITCPSPWTGRASPGGST